MNFCSHCGAPVELLIPEGDNLPRHVCGECGRIHYQNPRIITGCLPEWDNRVLLCRRAIEPRYGFWTVPGGFLENGESAHHGAMRETLEEANARVELKGLLSMFSLPYVNQVFMIYRARLLDLNFGPSPESLEVTLFKEREIPWEQIAFSVVTETLRLYFRDRQDGRTGMHIGSIERTPEQPRSYRVDML